MKMAAFLFSFLHFTVRCFQRGAPCHRPSVWGLRPRNMGDVHSYHICTKNRLKSQSLDAHDRDTQDLLIGDRELECLGSEAVAV